MIYLMRGGELRLIDEEGKLSPLEYDLEYYIDNREEYCVIEEGFSIKDLFLMIEKNSDAFTLIFSESILQYTQDIKEDVEIENGPVDYICFQWMCIEKDGYIKDTILRYPVFNANYIQMIEEYENGGQDFEEDPFSLNDFHISEIRDAKIILKEKFEVFKYEDNLEDGIIKINKDTVPIFSTKKRFLFSDVIYETIFSICQELEYEIEQEILQETPTVNEENIEVNNKVNTKKSGIEDMYKNLDDLEKLL